MAVLDHPNVVRVLDVGAEDGHFFFVMELGAGGSLSDYLRRFGARPVRESLGYVLQVLRGLDYAHASGVVHRDIKPHNMLLAVEPDPERDAAATLTAPTQTVKLTDFGIARHIATAIDGPRLTGTGDTLGTLAYMSPEQRTDPRNVGPESDLYGVGATLYILLTGRRPFDLAMIDSDRSVMERLPPALRPLVRRATATRPQDRHPSARAMAEDVVAAWEAVGGDAGDAVGALAGFAVEGSDTLVAPLGDGTGFDGDTSGD